MEWNGSLIDVIRIVLDILLLDEIGQKSEPILDDILSPTDCAPYCGIL